VEAITRLIPPRTGAARALLVEDDQDLAEVVTALLEARSVDVLHASTAGAAVRLATRFVPDVLILDIALPGADGFSVIDSLRADERLRSVPVVVYSGREVGPEDRDRLRLGTTQFLTKTKVTPEELELRIATLLGRVVAPGSGGDATEETEG
jgi:DNA-binding response OmpR family regulator